MIDAASRQPERLEELVQCVFSADEIVRMRASDALEKVCRASPTVRTRLVERLHLYQHSQYKSVAARARKLLTEFDSKPPRARPPATPAT